MWWACKDAGRPWPTLSDDDVIDYMVMEAVALKVRKQEAARQKQAERDQWKREQQQRLKEQFG